MMDIRANVITNNGMNTMATMAELEQNYYEITELYDLAEELVDTVENEMTQDPEAHIQLIEPLVDEISEATDILTEEYMVIVEGQQPRKANRKMESALRRIYVAIDAYHKRAEKAAQGTFNTMSMVVKKIVRQMEAVVAVLIDFVELSLDRIMTHSYAEQLRMRQEKIAMMLHSIGQGAS